MVIASSFGAVDPSSHEVKADMTKTAERTGNERRSNTTLNMIGDLGVEGSEGRPRYDTASRFASSAFHYFDRYSDPVTGLVKDSSCNESSASIAGTGMALSCFAIAAELGYLDREEAARRALLSLRFLSGTGFHGFFYHFMEPRTGRRAGRSEISTIDSAILFAGALSAAEYFDGDTDTERDIRILGEQIYLDADWEWASPRPPLVSHGWTPERGFLRYDWRGYNEALLLYILALGSPTHPVPTPAYDQWLSSYKWKSIYGYELVYGGPLFLHQTAHSWIDFRGIQDSYMREKGIDYFENSRRATHVQREYAVRNPRNFAGYGENCWGVSASTGPGSGRFHSYRARGVPFGPDDGTISSWATAASLPFAPEIVLPALEYLEGAHSSRDGFAPCFNQSFSTGDGTGYWMAAHSYAIDQGPILMMMENHRSGLMWNLLRRSPHVRRGLERAGFTGGWL